MNPISIKHKQPGFTLIEILIALVLGSFLLAGIIQVFLGSKNSYRMQEDLSRMQESGRFAIDFLGQDIRAANYLTCFSDPTPLGTGGLPRALTGAEGGAAATPDSITLTQKTNVCGGAAAPGTTSSITYTIQNDAGNNNQPTLYRAGQPLIAGIANMQILYGEDTDTDGTPEYYVDAGNVANMDQVVSVRVTLTTRSLNDNLTINVNPSGDRRLRQTYSSTIALRNRLQ